MGLKSVIFLCRMYLSIHFSPKRIFVLSADFFYFDKWIQHAFCPSRGNKNSYGSNTKTPCISIGKDLFIKTYKCFLYLPYHSFSLRGCYNAIYVTLDKIQTRTSVHPYKPNHYVNDSFFSYFLSLCFKWKKVLHNFCLRKRNGLNLRFGKSGL